MWDSTYESFSYFKPSDVMQWLEENDDEFLLLLPRTFQDYFLRIIILDSCELSHVFANYFIMSYAWFEEWNEVRCGMYLSTFGRSFQSLCRCRSTLNSRMLTWLTCLLFNYPHQKLVEWPLGKFPYLKLQFTNFSLEVSNGIAKMTKLCWFEVLRASKSSKSEFLGFSLSSSSSQSHDSLLISPWFSFSSSSSSLMTFQDVHFNFTWTLISQNLITRKSFTTRFRDLLQLYQKQFSLLSFASSSSSSLFFVSVASSHSRSDFSTSSPRTQWSAAKEKQDKSDDDGWRKTTHDAPRRPHSDECRFIG